MDSLGYIYTYICICAYVYCVTVTIKGLELGESRGAGRRGNQESTKFPKKLKC